MFPGSGEDVSALVSELQADRALITSDLIARQETPGDEGVDRGAHRWLAECEALREAGRPLVSARDEGEKAIVSEPELTRCPVEHPRESRGAEHCGRRGWRLGSWRLGSWRRGS